MWNELSFKFIQDILELPFRGHQPVAFQSSMAVRGNLGAPWASLSPPTPAVGHWRALCLGSWGLVQLGLAEEGEQPAEAPRPSFPGTQTSLAPLRGPAWLDSSRNGSFSWRHGAHFTRVLLASWVCLLFGRGFEKKTCMGGGLWLVLITWYLVVDIWSVGCIMAEMVLHKVLFPGRDCILHRRYSVLTTRLGAVGLCLETAFWAQALLVSGTLSLKL